MIPAPRPIRRFFSHLSHSLRAPESAIRSGGIRPQVVLILWSVVVLIVSQLIRADIPREFRLIPLLMIPLNLALFFLGIWAVDKNRLPDWAEASVQALAARLGITSGQFFSLLFSLFFSILTSVAAGFLFRMWSPQAAVICWGLGILLAVYGGWDLLTSRQSVSRLAILSGLAVFAGALILRSINTASIPIVLSGDEASSGLTAVNMLRGQIDNLFITAWFSFPSFHNFLQSISIAIFGQTTEALRLLAALGGALTVAGVYFVGRSMFGHLTGLMAAIFLAGFHFHNHFSRVGLNNIWDGVFFTLVVGALWIGWQREKRAGYLLAGLGLGLAQYFYTTGRTLFLVIAVWLLVAGLFDRKRLRRAIPGLLLMLWVAFIVVLPLAWFYLKHPSEFFAPMNRVTIMGSWLTVTAANTGKAPGIVLLQQIWRGMLGYVEMPLNAWYTPGVPLLRTLPGIVFLLGLVLTVLRWKDNRSQLLVIWLFWFAITGGMSESTPAAQRYVAAAPAIALLIAFSLLRLGELFKKLWPNRERWIRTGLLVVVILLAADDIRFYYFDYTPRSDFAGFNGMVAQRLADRLKSEPAGTELVFCGYPNMGYDSINSLPYLAPQIQYYNVLDPWNSTDTPQPGGDHVFFAFLPNHEYDRQAMELDYPGGTWQEWHTLRGESLLWLYEYRRP
jgi:4-amino-4-deoxy-L-arabinose transferase-like glycosyltransferase